MAQRGFKQLTARDRLLSSKLRAQQLSVSEIARRIGKNKSTVSPELRRNQTTMTPQQAHFLFRVKQLWSEEELNEYLQTQPVEKRQVKKYCHDYVYALLHRDRRRGGKLYRLLKRFGKRKQRLGDRDYTTLAPGRVGIGERPKFVDEWSRLGNHEGDLIVGYRQSRSS